MYYDEQEKKLIGLAKTEDKINYKQGYTIYIVHDMELPNSEPRKYLIILVAPDGSKEIYDKDNHMTSVMNEDLVKTNWQWYE